MQETPTAPQTQEDVPLPTPAAEAPPAPEVGEPQPTVAAEEATPAPEAGEPEALDPYEVLERPEFKTHLQRRDTRVEERLSQQYNQQLEAATKDWESTQTHQTIHGLIGNLSARLEESNFEGADRMLSRLEKFREPYTETYRNQLQNAGSRATATQFFGLLMNNLGVREQDELQAAAGPGAKWEDIVEKFGALKQKGADDRAHKRLMDERNAANAADQQVQQAKPVAALAPASSAGGTDFNKARQDYAEGRMSTSEAERLGIV